MHETSFNETCECTSKSAILFPVLSVVVICFDRDLATDSQI